MLERRFTVVCLITMLFAIGFARIVAQSSEGPAQWRGNAPDSCALYGQGCRPEQAKLARVR